MFGFLKRWFWKRRRSIFAYWDGARTRRVDPMAVWQALTDHPRFDWETTPKLIDLPGDSKADRKLSMESLALTAEAVRLAFDLPDVEEGGLTQWECVGLLTQFVGYLEGLKKSTGRTPTSRERSGPGSSAGSATSNGSASGSTVTGPSAAGQSAS